MENGPANVYKTMKIQLFSEKSVWLISGALFWLSVIYKSNRQVLIKLNNLQLLLRLPILDKFRLVTFHLQATQRNYNNWFILV
jgi:hypothetical protein